MMIDKSIYPRMQAMPMAIVYLMLSFFAFVAFPALSGSLLCPHQIRIQCPRNEKRRRGLCLFNLQTKNLSLLFNGSNPLEMMILIQEKSKKHKKLSSKSVHYRHAAQIYAEMLSQVCHKEFYNNEYTNYQDVHSL
jgi:hypothetical protein